MLHWIARRPPGRRVPLWAGESPTGTVPREADRDSASDFDKAYVEGKLTGEERLFDKVQRQLYLGTEE